MSEWPHDIERQRDQYAEARFDRIFEATVAERDRLRAERDAALATIGRLDEDVAKWVSRAVDAEATIERVKELHIAGSGVDSQHWCQHCGHRWPCPTAAALEPPKATTFTHGQTTFTIGPDNPPGETADGEYPTELDDVSAEHERLHADNYQLATGRDVALATIERVKALVAEAIADADQERMGTHWDGCHRVHHDCLGVAIRAALDSS